MKSNEKSEFYSLVKNDNLKLLMDNTSNVANSNNIFENKHKIHTIDLYKTIHKVLNNTSIPESEKISKLNTLVYNFDKNLQQSKSKLEQYLESKPPSESVSTLNPSTTQTTFTQNKSNISNIHHKVKTSYRSKSKSLLSFLEKRGLKYDTDNWKVHHPSMDTNIDTILEHLTNKRSSKLNIDEEKNIQDFVKYNKIPNYYIRNTKYQLSKHVGTGSKILQHKPKKKCSITKKTGKNKKCKQNKEKFKKPKWVNYKV